MDLIEPPNQEDCCNSGCNPCIFDVYEEKLRKIKLGQHNLKMLKNCISDTSYSTFRVITKLKHTENSFLIIFEYSGQSQSDDLNLYFEPGQHFLMKSSLKSTSESFTRAYTPLLSDNLGRLQFRILVKLYDGGMMSKIINKLNIGSETLWRGPYGDFKISYDFRDVLMIAQGTGIAPIYSVIIKMVNDENFEGFIKLFYCCNEIFLHDEIYELKKYWNFDYEVFLGGSKKGFCKYNEIVHENRLGETQIGEFLKNKSENVQVLICGGENFSGCIKNYLKSVQDKNIFVF
nr:NADH-cytochrome b5 reductase-like [Onthophagus taurus]